MLVVSFRGSSGETRCRRRAQLILQRQRTVLVLRLVAKTRGAWNMFVCHCASLVPAWMFTRGRGLTFTFARVLPRALVVGPGIPPTDAEDHTRCAVRALTPTLASLPLHVCRRQGTGLSQQGSHMQRNTVTSLTPSMCGRAIFPRTRTLDPKMDDDSLQDMDALGTCCTACLTLRQAQERKVRYLILLKSTKRRQAAHLSFMSRKTLSNRLFSNADGMWGS